MQDADTNQRRALAERDSIIQKLGQSLEAKEKALGEMQDAKRQEDGDAARERDEVIEQLKTRLRDKDKMLEVSVQTSRRSRPHACSKECQVGVKQQGLVGATIKMCG